jgi:hypothetical protein
MNKRILAGLVVLLLAGAGIAIGLNMNRSAANGPEKVKTATAKPSATPMPTPTPRVVKYEGVAGKTALELLMVKDPKAVTKGEGANAFVTTIQGYEADEAKKEFWAFYVNGKQSDVGAGAYATKPGDQIEWKIEKY